MKPYPENWSSYSGPLRAILDEYSRAIIDLERVVTAISSDRYASKTELSDKDFSSIGDIMDHVISAGHGYADDIKGAIEKIDRARQAHDYQNDSPATAMSSLWSAFSHMVEVLGGIKDYSENQLAQVRFTSTWGTEYDLEQILEHAIVHILRHRRQIENWLALAPLAS